VVSHLKEQSMCDFFLYLTFYLG